MLPTSNQFWIFPLFILLQVNPSLFSFPSVYEDYIAKLNTSLVPLKFDIPDRVEDFNFDGKEQTIRNNRSQFTNNNAIFVVLFLGGTVTNYIVYMCTQSSLVMVSPNFFGRDGPVSVVLSSAANSRSYTKYYKSKQSKKKISQLQDT